MMVSIVCALMFQVIHVHANPVFFGCSHSCVFKLFKFNEVVVAKFCEICKIRCVERWLQNPADFAATKFAEIEAANKHASLNEEALADFLDRATKIAEDLEATKAAEAAVEKEVCG